MTTGCKSTLSRKARGRAKANTKTQKGTRTNSTSNTSNTDSNTCKNSGRTGHWVKDCWRQVEEPTTLRTGNNSYTHKGRSHKKSNGKGKHVGRGAHESSLQKQSSTLSYPFTDTESRIEALLVQSRRATERLDHDPWRSDNQFPVFQRETNLVQSICFLTVAHSCTHVRSNYPGTKRYFCLILESTQRLELASNMTEDVW